MVLTADIVLVGRHSSFDQTATGLIRQPTPVPGFRPEAFKRLKTIRASSCRQSGKAPQQAPPIQIQRAGHTSASDGLVLVTLKDSQQRHNSAEATQPQAVPQSNANGGISSAKAALQQSKGGRSCTAHIQSSNDPGSAGPLSSSAKKFKSKLKAAALFLAEGLTWSTNSRAAPAFPVPIYYPPIIA